jgi:hypothetical protein
MATGSCPTARRDRAGVAGVVAGALCSAVLSCLSALVRRLDHPAAMAIQRFVTQDRCMRMLRKDSACSGARYDGDGDITFERGTGTGEPTRRYWVVVSQRDSACVSVFQPRMFVAGSPLERQRALHAAMRVNADASVVKVFFSDEDSLVAAVELYSDSRSFTWTFSRSMAALDTAARLFAKHMADLELPHGRTLRA